MAEVHLIVDGMHCKSCKMLIEDVLNDLGATKIKIEVDEAARVGKVSFESQNKEKAIKAIENEGYKVRK